MEELTVLTGWWVNCLLEWRDEIGAIEAEPGARTLVPWPRAERETRSWGH